MPEVDSAVPEDGRIQAKKGRLDFAAKCVAEVFPDVKDDRQTKRIIFRQASMWGMEQDADRPAYFTSHKQLRTYIRNHWSVIRLLLPELHNILPCYVNGPAFGGGGYHKGNAKLARKQVERDAKIADGVVTAADDFAKATVGMFPQIEVVRRHLVTRRIGR